MIHNLIITHALFALVFMVMPSLFWGSVFTLVVDPKLGSIICNTYLIFGLLTLLGAEQ